MSRTTAHRRRDQAGQTLPMVMFFMVALLGIAGLVVDVGGWYLQKRQVQAAADASALAGANQLPAGWSYAQTAAQTEYTNNGKAGDSTTTTNTTDLTANDSVAVSASRVAGLPDARLRAVRCHRLGQRHRDHRKRGWLQVHR